MNLRSSAISGNPPPAARRCRAAVALALACEKQARELSNPLATRERAAVEAREALAAGRPTITLVRVSRRSLDLDNLAGSLKAVRDATATWLGVDDGPKGPITWAYAQEVTKSPLMRVRIEVGA